MPKMTRSDIVLAIHHAKTIEEKDNLIYALNNKIENVYTILFGMEKEIEENPHLKSFEILAQFLRKALES